MRANTIACHSERSEESLLFVRAGTTETLRCAQGDKPLWKGRNHEPGTTVHPALSPDEIEALVTYIRTWEKK